MRSHRLTLHSGAMVKHRRLLKPKPTSLHLPPQLNGGRDLKAAGDDRPSGDDHQQRDARDNECEDAGDDAEDPWSASSHHRRSPLSLRNAAASAKTPSAMTP